LLQFSGTPLFWVTVPGGYVGYVAGALRPRWPWVYAQFFDFFQFA
jgi:hypothetical protein